MNRRIACALLFACLAALLFLRQTPMVFLLCAAATAAFGLLGTLGWAERKRFWPGLMVGVGLVWVVIRCVASAELSATFVAEALLLALALEFVRVPDWSCAPKRVPLFGGATLVACMYQRVEFAYLMWFCLLGILCVVAIIWVAAQERMARAHGFLGRRLSTTLAILGIAGFASFEASVVWGEQLSAMENRIDLLLSNFVNDSIPTLYPRTGTLNSINMERMTNPNDVAVRVYSRTAPGYLTGRVFDDFNPRRLFWRLISPEVRFEKGLERMHAVRPSTDSGIRVPKGQNLFQVTRANPSKRWATYELQNTSGRGEMVFTPHGTQFVRGYGRVIRTDDHGVVHSGLNCESKYVIYADPTMKQPDPGVIREVLLNVPERMRTDLGQLASQIAEGKESFEDRVASVKKYFDTDFAYSYKSPRPPRGTHFLTWFATQNKKGHCEMFATAAVMLLRLQGIPARYVTGYVCRNKDPEDKDYWAALNSNCHAWAEAWNADESRWEVVETTPGMRFDEAMNSAAFDDDGSLSEMFDESSGGGSANITTYGWVQVVQWVGLIGFGGLLCWSWFRFADRNRKPEAANLAILKLDKRLAKQGLAREPGETLSEFAARIESSESRRLSEDFLKQAANFYRKYAELLYRGDEVSLAVLSSP